MIATRRRITLAIAGMLLCSLTACGLGNFVNPPAAQGQQALDDFMRALRLEEYSAAASHLIPEHQPAFLETFAPLSKDLTIIDVRLERIDITEEGRQADVALELEYYLLPSAVVKSFHFEQTWVYLEGGKKEPSHYLVETPFPPFP